MSEFTYGNIVRTVDKTKLVEHLPKDTPTLKLSEDWFAFFTPEDGEFVSPKLLKTLSSHCPILYFSNLEDHGWSFEILYEGEVLSSLQVMYEFMDDDDEKNELLDEYEKAYDFVLDEYIQQNPSAEAFRVFELTNEQIKSIEELLAGNLTFDDEDFVAVETFKELLGIQEMSWIRYDRTDGREEIDYI
ncbi:hypothetical protein [Paenibacillus sinopodophylli]|uniref:hypothetical protein n=1 Tax=Paenibacillus sinopodophylli TaxID=1837342 RepID=UPI00110CA037|nr:hypothetical protein [Paenibacillus sinopodophylli]